MTDKPSSMTYANISRFRAMAVVMSFDVTYQVLRVQ